MKNLMELLLEPTKVYQKALYDAGIPCTVFSVADIDMEYDRLTKLGVTFSMQPTQAGSLKLAIFNDTCGNK